MAAFSRYIGIDHGFSFPLRYFEVHRLPPDWPRFLEDFQRHWPTDAESTCVDFVRYGLAGNGAARSGNARWKRLTEERAGSAKSVFHFDVQGQVAKSTHAGIPWLLYLKRQSHGRVHFWPFDGTGSSRSCLPPRTPRVPTTLPYWDYGPGCSSIRRTLLKAIGTAKKTRHS